MQQCIFCRIASKEIPAQVVYEDETLIAFHDASPQAPTHILVIPRQHYRNLPELLRADPAVAGYMLCAVEKIATQLGLEEKGFRVVVNTGADGGQTIGEARRWHRRQKPGGLRNLRGDILTELP